MLKIFTIKDFLILNAWIPDADLLLQFSGTDFTFPLMETQIVDYQATFPDRCFYLGYLNERPFAFGEIIPQESGKPRLGRILIGDPFQRGKGLGKYFINLLVDECRNRFQTDGVELYTHDKNIAAIKCYESAGFVYHQERFKTLRHNNQDYNIHKMTYQF